MSSHLRRLLVASSLVLGGIMNTATARPQVPDGTGVLAVGEAPEDDGWIVKKADHVCGIADPKKISSPAKVDYQECLEATPPMKKMKEEGIDPDSPEGKALRAKAVQLVAKAAEKVRESLSYCSVWKKIEHSDGRAVPEVTDDVVQEVEDEED